MEPKQLRYFEIRSEEGDQGDSHNNIDVAVQVSLTDSFRLSGSLLPEKLNALLTSQVRVVEVGVGVGVGVMLRGLDVWRAFSTSLVVLVHMLSKYMNVESVHSDVFFGWLNG